MGKHGGEQVSLALLTLRASHCKRSGEGRWGQALGWHLSTCVLACVPLPRDRVLLRVRMLYYLKAEVLGEAADKAFEGTPAR